MVFQSLPRKTVTIKLENAFITRIEAAASLEGASANASESVELTFGRIIFTTPLLDAKGAVIGQSSVCLDQAGKAC